MDAETAFIDVNEVVADSEDEMESFPGAQNHSISSVSAFTTINYNLENPQKIMSSISDFNTSRFGDGISAAPSSIADRAKTRQRTQAKKPAPVVNGDLIELTSDEEVNSVVTRSKLMGQSKPKPKPKLKTKEKELPRGTKPADQNVMVAVPNEEPPRPRPRPRPKPIVKRNRTVLDSDPLPPHPYPFARDALPGANIHFTPSSSHRDGPEIPIATSPDFFNTKISQLPPSDPPYPSMMTEREDDAPRPLPPIEILHERDSDREGGKRASSPSSLFSGRSSIKRKRRVLDMDNEPQVDQLVSSSPPRPGLVRTHDAPLLPAYSHPYGRVHEEDHVMPPTFFAGSSSSAGRNEEPPEPFVLPPQPEVVDLTDLPPTIDASVHDTNSTSKTLSKHKKASKPTALLRDFDAQLPMRAFENNELDSDFDPAGEPASKKSAKGKKKGKGLAKEKKAPAKKRREQLDGVVLTSRKKVKGKGKGKESTEEVFKSREFIEDSEDDDPLRLVGGAEMELTSGVVSHPSSKSRAIPSPSTPVLNPIPTSTKSVSSKHNTPASIVPASSSTKRTNSKNKKRKSVVDTDDEVAAQDTGAEGGDSIVVKRRRKASTSVLSNGDEAAPPPKDAGGEKSADKQHDDAKKGKTHRKTGQRQKVSQPTASANGGDDGANEDTNIGQHDEADLEDMEPQIPQKENAVPTPAPAPKLALSAVKPPRSRTSSINADGTTPLYARYEVAPRRSSLPMSELIRRASSKPSSPFPLSTMLTPSLKDRSKNKISTNDIVGTSSSTPSTPSSVMPYSPYLKSSRRALSRIAPLHPNRKTPPPPPPPPPPKKKTKKELEREEKWEEELVESIGGIDAWAAMNEADRKEMRRAKWEMELGGYED